MKIERHMYMNENDHKAAATLLLCYKNGKQSIFLRERNKDEG